MVVGSCGCCCCSDFLNISVLFVEAIYLSCLLKKCIFLVFSFLKKISCDLCLLLFLSHLPAPCLVVVVVFHLDPPSSFVCLCVCLCCLFSLSFFLPSFQCVVCRSICFVCLGNVVSSFCCFVVLSLSLSRDLLLLLYILCCLYRWMYNIL